LKFYAIIIIIIFFVNLMALSVVQTGQHRTTQ